MKFAVAVAILTVAISVANASSYLVLGPERNGGLGPWRSTGGPWRFWNGALYRTRDGTWTGGYHNVKTDIAVPAAVTQNAATYITQNLGSLGSGTWTNRLRDVAVDIAVPTTAAQKSATYVAENLGSVHVAPLIGHTQSVQSLNLEPPPGAIL